MQTQERIRGEGPKNWTTCNYFHEVRYFYLQQVLRVGLLPNPSTAQNSKMDVAHNLIIRSNLDLTQQTKNKCQISVLACVHQSWQKKLLQIFRNKDRGEESTTERESLPWWIEGKNPAADSSSQRFN